MRLSRDALMHPRVRALAGVGVAVCAIAMASCEPCAGTSSCHTAPEVSYSGQIISHATGAAVAGVQLRFVRRSGPGLLNDTIRATSRDDGYFELRAQALNEGVLSGDLTVYSPPPHAPYTVPKVQLKTNTIRGDGGILGRVVVDPFMVMVGELHERTTGALIVGATVTMKRVSGAQIEPDTVALRTDENGRFLLMPQILDFANGDLIADFELDVPGAPRKYLVRQRHQVQYTDGGLRFVFLNAGRDLNYVAQVARRGSWVPMSGVTVEVTRTGGIPVTPESFTQQVNAAGGFLIQPEPLADGELVFDVTVRPPAPFPVEITRGLRIQTHDDDSSRHIGFFGVGSQAYLRAHFTNRATGLPLDSGVLTQVTRVGGGVDIVTPLATDSGLRALGRGGILNYTGATSGAGSVTFDVQVRFGASGQWETIRGLQVESRYDSLPNDVGTFSVGGSPVRLRRAP